MACATLAPQLQVCYKQLGTTVCLWPRRHRQHCRSCSRTDREHCWCFCEDVHKPAVAALCRFSSNHHKCGASMESTKRHPWAISPGRCAASFASQRLSACRRDNVLFSRACSPTRASFTSSIHQFTRMVSGWTHGRVDVVPSPPVCRQAGCSRLLPRHALWTYMCAIVVVLSAWAPASAIGAYDCASGGWLCDAKLTVIGTCRVRFSAVAVGSTRHPVRHAINNALRA